MSEIEATNMGGSAGATPARDFFIPSRTQIKELVKQAQNATRGRPVTPEERDQAIRVLTDAMTMAKSTRTRIIASRALATFESLDLRDLHHTERMKHEDGILDLRMRRAEEGKPNDLIAIQVGPVNELPLPDSMREHRLRIFEPGKN